MTAGEKLDLMLPDECCNPLLSEALEASTSVILSWRCPTCDTLWERHWHGDVMTWHPRDEMLVIGGRG